ESRLYHLRSCLWQQMERLGIETYRDDHATVKYTPPEWNVLLDRLVNRETSLFRHNPSFNALSELLPRVIAGKRRTGENSISLWRAGCSYGEEAYSIAIAATEIVDGAFWKIGVLGSDLSANALATA